MMEIHADLSQRAAVASDELPWVPSPMAGVERRMNTGTEHIIDPNQVMLEA